MTQFIKYVSVLLLIGIFLVSSSAVSAQQRIPIKDQQASKPHQKDGKAGIIVVDSVITDNKSADQPSPGQTRPDVAIEPGDIFQPRSSETPKSGDLFQLKPGDTINHDDISPGRR